MLWWSLEFHKFNVALINFNLLLIKYFIDFHDQNYYRYIINHKFSQQLPKQLIKQSMKKAKETTAIIHMKYTVSGGVTCKHKTWQKYIVRQWLQSWGKIVLWNLQQ